LHQELNAHAKQSSGVYDFNVILLSIYRLFVSNLAFLISLQHKDIYRINRTLHGMPAHL